MNAKEAAELIAPLIDASYPNDKDKIFDILTRALNKAWSEGVWLGMSKEAFVRSFCDNNGNEVIISPKGYDTLLACNVNCGHKLIRSNYFQFHKNGYGSVNREGGHWTTDVMDLGVFPTYRELNIKLHGCAKIGVRSLGPEPSGKFVTINGQFTNGENIFSYSQETVSIEGSTCTCKSVSKDTQETHVTYGIALPINENFNYLCDVDFLNIITIDKDVTLYGVEILAIYPNNEVERIASLDPHETSSKYRRYVVPRTCSVDSVVHGVFKVSKQAKVVYEGQPIIIDDEEALIALAMGIHKVYYKGEIEMGNAYILQGLTVLDKQKAQQEVAETNPIQVVGPSVDDVPEILKHMS